METGLLPRNIGKSIAYVSSPTGREMVGIEVALCGPVVNVVQVNSLIGGQTVPINTSGKLARAAIDESGHVVYARRNGMHVQCVSIDPGKQHLGGPTVGFTSGGFNKVVIGSANGLQTLKYRLAGLAALTVFGVPSSQPDVDEAIAYAQTILPGKSISDLTSLVTQTLGDVQREFSQPDVKAAIERVAEHLLKVKTLDEADADGVIDSLLT
jgi:hypothetical protein